MFAYRAIPGSLRHRGVTTAYDDRVRFEQAKDLLDAFAREGVQYVLVGVLRERFDLEG